MQVIKFGGTSVANADTMRRCVQIIQQKAKEETDCSNCISFKWNDGYIAGVRNDGGFSK